MKLIIALVLVIVIVVALVVPCINLYLHSVEDPYNRKDEQ